MPISGPSGLPDRASEKLSKPASDGILIWMNVPPIIAPMTHKDLEELKAAKLLLENPGMAIRLTNLLGAPLEKGFALLPAGWSDVVHKATRGALMKALETAVATLGKRRPLRSKEFFHKVLVGASGGIGGAFGLAALPLELPISTTIMLRSIADIARSEGQDISLIQTKLDCLEVFALGGRSPSDDAGESAYWVTRAALSKTVSEAATYLTRKGVVTETAPVLVRFVNEIASRFGVMVSQEVAAKAVPIVGAAGGGLVNVLFIDHFQDMARGHFIVKRLEGLYGIATVHHAYQDIKI